MIGQVQNDQIDYSQATSSIASIVNQRQDLQNQVAGVQPPAAFAAAAASLRQSISAALQDDYAIQSWINAWYQDDQVGVDNASFLTLYNRLRARYLHLAPLDVAY